MTNGLDHFQTNDQGKTWKPFTTPFPPAWDTFSQSCFSFRYSPKNDLILPGSVIFVGREGDCPLHCWHRVSGYFEDLLLFSGNAFCITSYGGAKHT